MRPTNIPEHAQAFPAPAKLNLDLRITGRRQDGYHDLESIFCLIGLYDTVYLAVRSDSNIVLHTPIPGVEPETDLTFRAASALQTYAGITQGADIWLEKFIPMGGGLGGGSSDAATVLIALNLLWQCGLPRDTLSRIGVTLGADVPFFIFGKNAFAKGIGDELVEMEVPPRWYVVVRPPVHVSTAVVFSHQNLTRNSKPSIMPSFQSLQPFRNDMQDVVFQEYPEVLQAYRFLCRYGSPLMTGSGACLFLGFDNEEKAWLAHRQISVLYDEAYCVKGLNSHPLLDI